MSHVHYVGLTEDKIRFAKKIYNCFYDDHAVRSFLTLPNWDDLGDSMKRVFLDLAVSVERIANAKLIHEALSPYDDLIRLGVAPLGQLIKFDLAADANGDVVIDLKLRASPHALLILDKVLPKAY